MFLVEAGRNKLLNINESRDDTTVTRGLFY